MHATGLTVVIPVKQTDESTFLLKTIISEALQFKIEVVIVVNCADQLLRTKTIEELSSIQHKYYRVLSCDFESPGRARNIGIAECKTRYITFWDSDDMPVVKEVNDLTGRLALNPTKKFGIGSFEIVDPTKGVLLSRHILNGEVERNRELIKNPGIWRWIFDLNRIEACRFQDFAMGEDQDFLADLNPKEDEIITTRTVTYKYMKGWKNQLTGNKSSINEISNSIEYLAGKVESQKGNYWHKKFLFWQLLTSMKRGSLGVKLKSIKLAFRLVWKNVSH